MRVVLRASLGVGNAYQLKHFDRALPGLVIADILAVTLDSLGYLAAHGEYRVERGHRVLENHGDLAGGAGYQAHYRESRYALATATLPYYSQSFSWLHREGDIINGFDQSSTG